jgi:hypothetical protein
MLQKQFLQKQINKMCWDLFKIFDPKIDGLSQGSGKLASDIMLGVLMMAQGHLFMSLFHSIDISNVAYEYGLSGF